MAVILVLTLSTLMQFTAAFFSLRLLKRFGGKLVWLTLALALFLMAIRRSLTLSNVIASYPDVTRPIQPELIALFISCLVMVAVIAFKPLIEHVIRSQKKLEEETERNNIILESSPDGVCITNRDGVIEEVNPAYCEMLGMKEDELVGTNIHLFTAAVSPKLSEEILSEIIEFDSGRYDLIQIDKSGKPVYIELIGRHVTTEEHDFIYLFLRDITARKNVEEALNQFKNTLDQTLDSVFMFCPDTLRFSYVNEGAIKHSGYKRDQLLGMTPVDIKPEFNEQGFRELINPMIQGQHKVLNFETYHQDNHGHHIPVEIFLQYVKFENNDPLFVAIVRDVSERHEAEAKLREQKERALVTLAAIGDGVITTNVTGQIDFMNQAAENLCGIRSSEARDKSLAEICKIVDEKTKAPVDDPVISALLKNGPLYLSNNLELQSYDNETIHSVEVVVSPIFDTREKIIGTVLVLHDTTELRGMAQQLTYQATHDSLTGLINRREFEKRLNNLLIEASESDEEHVMFYMDLDQFKIINDTCGHLAGDEMLLSVTGMFTRCMRESDTLARLGGDEFGVLLKNCSVEQARQVARKIHEEISHFRFNWEDNIFEVGVSIGIVPINNSTINISTLLSSADSACYVAKERGRNTQHVYISGDEALAQHHGQMKWYQQIQHAFDEDRFELYYQPIKSVKENDVTHSEILLRMKGELGEVISPIHFLPTAERYHMITDIDLWVIRNVFKCLNDTSSQLNDSKYECAINLSGQSLGKEEFLENVIKLFDEFEVDGSKICFEITETAVISNITQARVFMAEMKTRNVSFSLDDFGSGLSSFSYLKNLEVDYLKIDGSFVRNILTDKNDFNMVNTIIYLGHSLGLKTIAEFVENDEIENMLIEMGVDFIQGYGIAMPAPVRKLKKDIKDSESPTIATSAG